MKTIKTVLKGKGREEIIKAFIEKYNIPEYEWDNFVINYNKVETKKTFDILWTIPMFLFGICFVISLLISLVIFITVSLTNKTKSFLV